MATKTKNSTGNKPVASFTEGLSQTIGWLRGQD